MQGDFLKGIRDKIPFAGRLLFSIVFLITPAILISYFIVKSLIEEENDPVIVYIVVPLFLILFPGLMILVALKIMFKKRNK